MDCSTPVNHQEVSKLVKKTFIPPNTTVSTRSVTLPAPGAYAFHVGVWVASHTAPSSGTYHVHLSDLATAISGSQVYIINADGPNFHVD